MSVGAVAHNGSQGLPIAAVVLVVVNVGGSLYLFVDTKAGWWARFWLEYPAFAAAAAASPIQTSPRRPGPT